MRDRRAETLFPFPPSSPYTGEFSCIFGPPCSAPTLHKVTLKVETLPSKAATRERQSHRPRDSGGGSGQQQSWLLQPYPHLSASPQGSGKMSCGHVSNPLRREVCKAKQTLNCSIERRTWDRDSLQGRGAWGEEGQLGKIRRVWVAGRREQGSKQASVRSANQSHLFFPTEMTLGHYTQGFVEPKPETAITFQGCFPNY